MSDLSDYYARRYTVPKPKREPKVHYDLDAILKTLCGLASTQVRTTRDPNKVTCSRCYNSRYLDAELGNMTHTGS